MRKFSYLSLLILCAIFSQGIAVMSNDNAGKSMFVFSSFSISLNNIISTPSNYFIQ